MINTNPREGITPDMADRLAPRMKVHPGVISMLPWFDCGHLPQGLGLVALPFRDLAHEVAKRGGGPECTVAIRRLLEAKDAAVRAAIVANQDILNEPEADPDADTVVTEPPAVSDEEFQNATLAALKATGGAYRSIGQTFGVSASQVVRWGNGVSLPVPAARRQVVDKLLELAAGKGEVRHG